MQKARNEAMQDALKLVRVIELREPKPIPFDESKYKSPKSVDDVSEVVRTFRDIMDDIWESIHLDERGSFSFKDMAPEKIEAIRRLTEDARRAGVSVKDWMLKLKYPLAQAENNRGVCHFLL